MFACITPELNSLNFDGVVKNLHLLRYSGFSGAQHTLWLPSSLENRYALHMEIFTYPSQILFTKASVFYQE
jgi:hypothetical protein